MNPAGPDEYEGMLETPARGIRKRLGPAVHDA
jgi:hypothetical protein